MQLSERLDEYWARNRRLTVTLLILWFVTTLGVIWFADELNDINVIGPLGYYMGAQGALMVYLAIIFYYTRCMKQLDVEFGMDEEGK